MEEKVNTIEKALRPLLQLQDRVIANERKITVLPDLEANVQKTLSLLEPLEKHFNDVSARPAVEAVSHEQIKAIIAEHLGEQGPVDAEQMRPWVLQAVAIQFHNAGQPGGPLGSEAIEALIARRFAARDAAMETSVAMQVEAQLPAVESLLLRQIQKMRWGSAPYALDTEPSNFLQGPTGQRSGTPQQKATWVSGNFQSVAAVPDRESPDQLLDNRNLERSLAQKVVDRVPKGHVHELSKYVVREMANSVVQELVGIFESLLDRLLKEKKQDTIRTMVAELLNQDLSATLLKSHEYLKEREIGHIMQELKRLSTEINDSGIDWEERFRVTGELQKSQEDMSHSVNERCGAIEGQLAEIDSRYVQRMELDTHLASVFKQLQAAKERAAASEAQQQETSAKLSDLRTFCNERFVPKADLADVESRISEEIAASRDQFECGLQNLRENAALDTAHLQLVEGHEELKTSMVSLFEEFRREVGSLETALGEAGRYNDATFATSRTMDATIAAMSETLEHLRKQIQVQVANLEAISATKQALKDVHEEAINTSANLEATLSTASVQLDTVAADLRTLEGAAEYFATKDWAHETAKRLAVEAANECDDKAEIAELQGQLKQERDRINCTLKLYEQSRADLTATMDEVDAVRKQCYDNKCKFDSFRGQIDRVDGRSKTDAAQLETELVEQSRAHAELSRTCETFKQEFLTFVAQQRGEVDILSQRSTQRYLEQMDKAIGITSELDGLKVNHVALHETVQGLRLPPVQ